MLERHEPIDNIKNTNNSKTIANIKKAKQAIKKAFEVQLQAKGFGFVEILSSCPTNWKMSPQQAHERIRNEMMPIFAPGIYKDVTNL